MTTTRWHQKPWLWAVLASTAYWTWLSRPHDLSRGDVTWVAAGSAQLGAFAAVAATALAYLATKFKVTRTPLTTPAALALGALGLSTVWFIGKQIYPTRSRPWETDSRR